MPHFRSRTRAVLVVLGWTLLPALLLLPLGCDRATPVQPADPARPSADVAAASVAGDETITFFVTFDASGVPSATWTASGVFSDEGTAIYDKILHEAIPSPVTGTEHVETTMLGGRGTFRMRFDKDIGLGIPGRWVIRDGAGGYALLHGEGTWRFIETGPNTLTIPCVGTVHFD